jgi:hypothetical protein
MNLSVVLSDRILCLVSAEETPNFSCVGQIQAITGAQIPEQS